MKLTMHPLLVAAMVIAPFTLLRFGILGVAEVLVLLVFLIQATKGLRKSHLGRFVLTKFWLAYLGISMVGLAVNAIFLDESTSTWSQIAFDLGAYIFILATCFSLERVATHTEFDVKRFVADFVFWSGLVFFALYVVSRFTPSLLGLPLRYYDYFVPWAENLHQVSMSLVPMPFLALAAAGWTRGIARRIALLLLVPATFVMAISTGSSKALLAMYVGTFALAYSFCLARLGRRWFVHVNLFFATVAIAALAATNWTRIGEVLFEENDVGGVRGILYRHAIEVGLGSPLVGRGPGPHIELAGAYMDAHQTWLTAFLQAGIPGLVLFTVFVLYVARKIMYQPALLAAFSTLVVYAAGGDILRRLPAWIVIFSVLYYAVPAAREVGARSPKGGALPPGGFAVRP